MYGYELELQRQRNQRLQNEAETQRILSRGEKPAADLRRVLGQQLVKLGTRLQGDVR